MAIKQLCDDESTKTLNTLKFPCTTFWCPPKFSFKGDESLVPSNETIPLVYVRSVKKEKIIQDTLYVENLISKSQSIFVTV